MSFQVVITTHSPFIISDLPKENVIVLEKCQETGDCIIKSDGFDDIEQTFASNIHTLFSKSFFMETTVGEFAKNEINKIINLLNESRILTEDEKKKARNIIDIIGEPLIKSKLEEMYYTKEPFEKRKQVIRDQIRMLIDEYMELSANDTNKT